MHTSVRSQLGLLPKLLPGNRFRVDDVRTIGNPQTSGSGKPVGQRGVLAHTQGTVDLWVGQGAGCSPRTCIRGGMLYT